ncbi:hypothetical protein [Candidatus Sneabacter namystus]|uniref:Adhesin domain-containing protein n=1 Tax=Candidatus Sneabacter namystus TaxID=2601646 RepID=A0A5C0UH26_9RICK|nr:hypothetical protein [Candidatus Sneabacter namystus]QEK39398.1 hypothetical protein FZC37_00370 [Candidatus Sneabacter namystus]
MIFFRNEVPASVMRMNKGSFAFVNDAEHYFIKAPQEMQSSLTVNFRGSNVDVRLRDDFPDSDPIKVNLRGLARDAQVELKNGALSLDSVAGGMRAKVDNGSLKAKVHKADVNTLDAKVCIGRLQNSSDLHDQAGGAAAAGGHGHVHTSSSGAGVFGSCFTGMPGDFFAGVLGGMGSRDVHYAGEGSANVHLEVGNGVLDLC